MNNISMFLFIAGGLVLACNFSLKNSNFLDIRSILYQHIDIFKNSPLQFISIFIIPALFAIAIVLIRCIDKEILNNLNIVLSILIAMFFSVLSILTAFEQKNKNKKYQQLLNETFTTTIFEIILCLSLLLISFVALFISDFKNSLFLEIISVIIYYLTIVTILNILVIIKRLKVLFENK